MHFYRRKITTAPHFEVLPTSAFSHKFTLHTEQGKLGNGSI